MQEFYNGAEKNTRVRSKWSGLPGVKVDLLN
jgi:hypothetical protein